jgi:arginyl-tRNA synthetase
VRPFSARETVREFLVRTVNELAGEGFVGAVTADAVSVERTKRPEHGDFASNVALTLAKPAGKPPRAVAEAIVARLPRGEGSPLAEATVAGPGFINVRLSPSFWQAALGKILAAGADWGRGDPRATPKVLLEYLSANPTGPMHVAHGRHAAVGDALARLLRFAGYTVTTDFYINDAGNQVQTPPIRRSRRRRSPRTATRAATSASSAGRSSRGTAPAGSPRSRPPISSRSRPSRWPRRWR